MSQPVTLVSASDSGHRAAYRALFSALFPGRSVTDWRHTLADPNPALFLMIEESFVGYCAAAVLRALRGRRTAGLLFRPGPALSANTLRLWLKRAALTMLKRLPAVTTISLIPVTIAPDIARIADDWIFDPQMWDLPSGQPALPSASITAAAQRRPVVMALGRQDRDKGFDNFVGLYRDYPDLRQHYLFGFAGAIAPDCAALVDGFVAAGGWAENRFVSDDELLALYAAADLIWCAYAPGYDQASGIFGRAVQLGKIPIVRDGALLHKLCRAQGIDHIAITPASAGERLTAARVRVAATRSSVSDWRRDAIARLSHALGLPVPP